MTIGSSLACWRTLASLKSVLLFVTVTLLLPVHVSAEEQRLSLKDAILLGLEKGIRVRQLDEEKNLIELNRSKLESGKLTHEVTLSLSNSVNEVADTRDLDAFASESQQYILKYKQGFENGFSWTLSNKRRLDNAIEGNSEDDDFTKYLVVVDQPLYGKSAGYSRLSNRKTELQLESAHDDLSDQTHSLQSSIADDYFNLVLSHQKAIAATAVIELLRKKIQVKKLAKSQLTELEIQELEFELLQAKQDSLIRLHQFEQYRKKIAQLIGQTNAPIIPRLDPLPAFDMTLAELREKYRSGSRKLRLLNQQIQIQNTAIAISELDMKPSISVGGFLGTSKSLTESGNNYGVYLSLKYSFWGGQAESADISRQDLARLYLQIDEIEQELILQSQTDYQQMKANKEILNIRRLQKELLEKQLVLTGKKFKLGQLQQEDVISNQIKLIRSKSDFLEARVNYWRHFVKIYDTIGHKIIQTLES